MANGYDEVLYPSHAVTSAHPERLAVIARLFGMVPAATDCCRVLELGCGTGANLIALALECPQSRFLGIDSAAKPISRGKLVIEALEAGNIELRQTDIMEMGPDYGRFDYIIAHGVFSWVPPQIQEKLLELLRSLLQPQGVAFVSYNTFPGWHLSMMMREMMLYHTRRFEDPGDRIDQAHALVKFLLEAQSDAGPYRTLLEGHLRKLLEHQPAQTLHDDLAGINVPLYFHQFVDRAAAVGLQYLGEADFFEMQAHAVPEEARKKLGVIASDLHSKEQFLDFIKCRRFRQTLLCHQEVPLDRSLRSGVVRSLYAASQAEAKGGSVDLAAKAEVQWETEGGARLRTSRPIPNAALMCLNLVWPQALSFEELLWQSRLTAYGNSREEHAEDEEELAGTLLAAYAIGLADLHTRPRKLATAVSSRPVASPLARFEAAQGMAVTSLRHTTIRFTDEFSLYLLRLLDGSRDLEGILEEMIRYWNAVSRDKEVMLQDQAPPPPTREHVGRVLSGFARLGLLME